jgi:hypothetical protein
VPFAEVCFFNRAAVIKVELLPLVGFASAACIVAVGFIPYRRKYWLEESPRGFTGAAAAA